MSETRDLESGRENSTYEKRWLNPYLPNPVCACGAQKIADLARELKRARIEMAVRLNKPDQIEIPSYEQEAMRFDEGFEDAWVNCDPLFENAGYQRGHAAGRAAVEIEIERRMEAEDALDR